MVPYVSEYRFLLSVAPGFESKLDFFILGQSESFCIRMNKGKDFSSVDWRLSGRS